MEIDDFYTDLIKSIKQLELYSSHEILTEDEIRLKVRILLNPKGNFDVFYNQFRNLQSFTLIIENQRVWAVDKDYEGWHEHPLHDIKNHLPLEPQTIPQIIERLEQVWEAL